MHLSNNTLLQGGKYKIVRFLSSGGFGNTYEGVHTMMDTRVAIKEFFPKMFCNRDENTSHVTVATQGNRELVKKLRKKFNQEAKAIYKMKHENIVRVQDIFEENGTAYYVMEYIDGKSLHDIVNERGALPEAEAVGYIRQVADALKYVHSLKRLHLDIKPGNIMVDKNGKAILIDFGASKHYDMESGENTSTLMGVNTKGYAPIEQCTQSFTTFSPATDIYALGATLYKLLTGITPPDANLLLAEEEELKPMPSNITAATCNAVKSAMALRRKDRPQSVDEFVGMLSNKNDSPKEKVRFVHENKTESTSVDDEGTIIDSPNTPPNAKGFREKVYDDTPSKNVEELRKEAKAITLQYKEGYNYYVELGELPRFVYNLRPENCQKIIDMKDKIIVRQKELAANETPSSNPKEDASIFCKYGNGIVLFAGLIFSYEIICNIIKRFPFANFPFFIQGYILLHIFAKLLFAYTIGKKGLVHNLEYIGITILGSAILGISTLLIILAGCGIVQYAPLQFHIVTDKIGYIVLAIINLIAIFKAKHAIYKLIFIFIMMHWCMVLVGRVNTFFYISRYIILLLAIGIFLYSNRQKSE